MNLQDALGIVDWRQLTSTEGTQVVPFLNGTTDVWCVGEELMDCWADDDDQRWRLLLNIAQAFNIALETLQPSDGDDLSHDSCVLRFDGVSLPFLQSMLDDPSLKRDAWQVLCRQFH